MTKLTALGKDIHLALANKLKARGIPPTRTIGWDFQGERPRRVQEEPLEFTWVGVRSKGEAIRVGKFQLEGTLRFLDGVQPRPLHYYIDKYGNGFEAVKPLEDI